MIEKKQSEKSINKRKLYNIMMAAAVCFLFVGAFFLTGHIKGWFDKAKAGDIVAASKTGSVNITRSGATYALDENTVLRDSDIIEVLSGSSVTLSNAKDYVTADSDTRLAVQNQSGKNYICLEQGLILVEAKGKPDIKVGDDSIDVSDGVYLLSNQSGVLSLMVMSGELDYGGKSASAGEYISIAGDSQSVLKLDIKTLNDFSLHIGDRLCYEWTLCFDESTLREELARREEEKNSIIQEAVNNTEDEAQSNGTTEEKTDKETTTETAAGEIITEQPDTENPTSETPVTELPTTEAPTTEEPTTEQPEPKCTATLEIRCDSILSHMSDLTPGKEAYVPSSGTILAPVSVEFETGETVFDVLTRTTSRLGIQIEYSWTPAYGSYYIEGINQLYEFDCGGMSGWKYKVNGWFPNYGCSSYKLQDKDTIVFEYTCDGY